MKYSSLLFSLFCFILIASWAQAQTEWPVPVDEKSKNIIYDEVVPVAGVSKDILFQKANEWILDYYTAGQKKIREKDKEAGKILVKDRIILFKMEKKTKVNDVMIDYKVELNFKEGKYRYRIYDFYQYRGSLSSPLEEWFTDEKNREVNMSRLEQLNAQMEKLIENLKASMAKAEKENTEDW